MKKFLNVLDKMFMVLFTSFRGLCEIIGIFIIFMYCFSVDPNNQSSSTPIKQMWNCSVNKNGVIFTLFLIVFLFGLGYFFKTKIDEV